MEKDEKKSHDFTDYYGSIRKQDMEKIAEYTAALVAAIQTSSACTALRTVQEKLKENPQIRTQLMQFRKCSYELQNSQDDCDWYENMEKFAKENEDFLQQPLVEEYLNAETELCRILQHINQAVIGAIPLEIEDFADAIEW